LTAYSGQKTGRSPLDKRIVKEPSSEEDIWWGPVNKPMSTDVSCLEPRFRACVALFFFYFFCFPYPVSACLCFIAKCMSRDRLCGRGPLVRTNPRLGCMPPVVSHAQCATSNAQPSAGLRSSAMPRVCRLCLVHDARERPKTWDVRHETRDTR